MPIFISIAIWGASIHWNVDTHHMQRGASVFAVFSYLIVFVAMLIGIWFFKKIAMYIELSATNLGALIILFFGLVMPPLPVKIVCPERKVTRSFSCAVSFVPKFFNAFSFLVRFSFNFVFCLILFSISYI
jgi:hypothetical protein